MGTRNLTMVISNNETKVAQYGQWDGYPDGQGTTVLSFLLNTNLEDFKEKLKTVRFTNEKDEKEAEEFIRSIGSENGWVDGNQSRKYDEKYPYWSRDIAAEILQMIMASKDAEIVLQDKSDFASDSLFCEWCYVIDLDKNTLEVYDGFNQQPLSEDERFYPLQNNMEKDDKYYPVKLAKSFHLSNLPTEKEFLAAFETADEESED